VVAAKTITTPTIYRGAIPFVLLQVIGLAVVIAYPDLVTGTIRFFRSLF
jgi:TRAP-type mannitol/chloroaromatic compound transport system permease large subunit